MSNDEIQIREFLKGASAVPPCPTDKFVNSFLAQMDVKPETSLQKDGSHWRRIAAAFALVSFGVGAFFINQSNKQESVETLILASITDPEKLDSEGLSETIIYGENAEDAFAASLIGNDDISTLVSISDP